MEAKRSNDELLDRFTIDWAKGSEPDDLQGLVTRIRRNTERTSTLGSSIKGDTSATSTSTTNTTTTTTATTKTTVPQAAFSNYEANTLARMKQMAAEVEREKKRKMLLQQMQQEQDDEGQ